MKQVRNTGERLPLSAKEVATICMARLRSLAAGLPKAIQDRFVHLLLHALEPQWYSGFQPEGTSQRTSLSPDDLATMSDKDIIERAPAGTIPTGFLFAVPEWFKFRRRPIFHPKELNDWVHGWFKSMLNLKRTQTKIAESLQGGHAVAFDLKCSFFQVELDASVRNHYTFLDQEGNVWRFKRMVMGAVVSAELMHMILEILAFANMPPRLLARLTISTHIDNVRAIGTVHDTQKWAELFQRNCQYVGATLNDEAVNTPHTKGDWCGILYDYEGKNVCLAESTKSKIELLADRIRDPSLTVREFLALEAKLRYASEVLALHPAQFYYVIKFARRLAKRQLDAPANIWPSIIPTLHTWAQLVLLNVPRPVKAQQNRPMVLFSDASMEGYGGVLITGDGEVLTTGRTFSEHERFLQNESIRSINNLEDLALVLNLYDFKDLLVDQDVLLVVDNTTTIADTNKQSSKSFDRNLLMHKANDVLITVRSWSVHYINTALNPADAPSRGRHCAPSVTQLASAVVGGPQVHHQDHPPSSYSVTHDASQCPWLSVYPVSLPVY